MGGCVGKEDVPWGGPPQPLATGQGPAPPKAPAFVGAFLLGDAVLAVPTAGRARGRVHTSFGGGVGVDAPLSPCVGLGGWVGGVMMVGLASFLAWACEWNDTRRGLGGQAPRARQGARSVRCWRCKWWWVVGGWCGWLLALHSAHHHAQKKPPPPAGELQSASLQLPLGGRLGQVDATRGR